MRRLFKISIWGYNSIMSDYKIHKTIMEQSKVSNYNWLTSADELVTVCRKPKFNKEYANEIKGAILNCYTSLYYRGEVYNALGAYRAFNDLLKELKESNDESINITCRRFLGSFIYRMTFLQGLASGSKSYSSAYHEYRNNKIDQLMKEDYVDFGILPREIDQEFNSFVYEHIKNGTVTIEPIHFSKNKIAEPEFGDNNNLGSRVLKK